MKKAKSRARKLYNEYLTKNNSCIVIDDETYVFADFQQLPGREFYIGYQRFGVAQRFRKNVCQNLQKNI